MWMLDVALVLVTVIACAAALTLWRRHGGERDVTLPDPDLALIAAIGGDGGWSDR